MQQQRRLQMRANFVNKLRDRFGRIRAPADLHNFGRMLELVGQLLDFTRERRGEHQRLAFLRQRFHDPANRRKKTHVEHSIGLVEHEKLDARKVGYSLIHQIDQPPRRGHDQIDTGTQRLDLRTFAHAAENRGHAQRNVFRVSAHVLLDLHHQLASRRDHQRARSRIARPVTTRCGELGRFYELHQNRQNESSRFSGAGLRDADDIVSRENERDRRDLDRSWLGVAGVIDGLQDLGGKIECAK